MQSVSKLCDTRSLQSRGRVKTLVTRGEGVRHPHTSEEVSLPRPIHSCVANVGKSCQIMYARGARCKMPCHDFENYAEYWYKWNWSGNMHLKHESNAQPCYQCSEIKLDTHAAKVRWEYLLRSSSQSLRWQFKWTPVVIIITLCMQSKIKTSKSMQGNVNQIKKAAETNRGW